MKKRLRTAALNSIKTTEYSNSQNNKLNLFLRQVKKLSNSYPNYNKNCKKMCLKY